MFSDIATDIQMKSCTVLDYVTSRESPNDIKDKNRAEGETCVKDMHERISLTHSKMLPENMGQKWVI